MVMASPNRVDTLSQKVRKYHLPPLLFKPIVWITIPKHKRKYLQN